MNNFLYQFIRRNVKDILVILFFSLFLPLFFYNLGSYSLVDFDEAWYAEIARNILVSRQPFLLSFNCSPYLDHPPLGFILIAISFLIFGINEFAARFPSALFGFSSVILLYFIGKNLFNRIVGIGAGLMLLSSVWFIFRSRSGNLDTVFLFFYLLLFYAALKVKNSKNWIYLAALAFSFSLLVKSMIGTAIIVPIILLWLINMTKMPIPKIIQTVLLFFLILSPWLVISYLSYGFSYFTHIFNVGLRSGTRMMPNFVEIGSSLTFKYLHFGIREWFYPALIALIGSLIFLLKKPVLIVLYVWFLILLFGFLTNSKTEIWHLIPLYPIIGLFVAFFLYQIVFYSLELVLTKKIIFPEKLVFLLRKNLTMIVSIAVFCLILVLSLKQIYEFRNEVKLFDKDTSGLAYTASAAKGLPEKLYLDNEFFLPGSVFYSQKQVRNVKFEDFPNNSLKGIIAHGQKPFLLLTEQWRLDLDNIVKSKYELLAEHKGHALIRVLE